MSTNISDLANEILLKNISHFTYFLFYKTLQSFSHKKKKHHLNSDITAHLTLQMRRTFISPGLPRPGQKSPDKLRKQTLGEKK